MKDALKHGVRCAMVVGGIQSCGQSLAPVAGRVRPRAEARLGLHLILSNFRSKKRTWIRKFVPHHHHPMPVKSDKRNTVTSQKQPEGKFTTAREITTALQDQNETSLNKSMFLRSLMHFGLTWYRLNVLAEPVHGQV